MEGPKATSEGLDLNDLSGSFQPKPFYDSMSVKKPQVCWRQLTGNESIRKLFSHLLYVKDTGQLILRDMQVCIPFKSPDVYYLNFGMKDT